MGRPGSRRVRLTRFEWGCLLVVALAFLVRSAFFLQPTIIWDSAWYLMLARSFSERGDFWLRWTDPAAPQFSGYWPPLFPIFVAPLVKIFGPSYSTLVLGSILSSALLTTAVFFCTRDLLGRTQAFAAMALVAANPAFYVSDSKGMSEALLGLTVVLTVWAFLKSLDRPAYLPLAGAFAFLAYLGKASLGLPFVVAGVAALGAWRVWTRGWRRVLTSKVDVGLALGMLVVFAILAATRTERIGGLGVGLIEPLARSFREASCSRLSWFSFLGEGAHCWFLLYPLKVAFVGVFLLVVTLPFSLRLRHAIRAPRSERTDALWLATILPLVAGAIFTTSFYFTESRNLIDFDNIRYLTPAMVPFLWLVLPHWRFEETPPGVRAERVARSHHVWFALAVGSYFVLELLNPVTGAASLERLVAFLVLCGVPLTLGLFAYLTQYGIAERKVPGGIERRYVPATARRPDGRVMLGALVVLVASAWYFSVWYVTVGIGLVVALTTMSGKLRALGMALVLLGSSAPGVQSALPVEEAAEALAKLPPGTIVGASEQVIFPAAVAPDHVVLRLVDPHAPIPDDVDVLLMQQQFGAPDRTYENFTRVASYEYGFFVSPTLRLRLWIEQNVLGQQIEFQRVQGEAIYVRAGSGLDALYPAS